MLRGFYNGLFYFYREIIWKSLQEIIRKKIKKSSKLYKTFSNISLVIVSRPPKTKGVHLVNQISLNEWRKKTRPHTFAPWDTNLAIEVWRGCSMGWVWCVTRPRTVTKTRVGFCVHWGWQGVWERDSGAGFKGASAFLQSSWSSLKRRIPQKCMHWRFRKGH